MSEPFIGEVRMFGFQFAPKGWAFCDGQVLNINDNPALYSILGTHYGGNGVSTFGLPDLRGRTPLHRSPSYSQGSWGGLEGVALQASQLPAHGHVMQAASGTADSAAPTGKLPAQFPSGETIYGTGSEPLTDTMNAASISLTGGGDLHNNMQPYLPINFCISLTGQYPSRN